MSRHRRVLDQEKERSAALSPRPRTRLATTGVTRALFSISNRRAIMAAKLKQRSRATPPPVVVNGQTLNAAQERIWRIANEDIGSGELARMKRGLAGLRGLERDLTERLE